MAVILLIVFVICTVLDDVLAFAFGTRMDGDGDYHNDPAGSDLNQYRLSFGYAHRLSSRWQAAIVRGLVALEAEIDGIGEQVDLGHLGGIGWVIVGGESGRKARVTMRRITKKR